MKNITIVIYKGMVEAVYCNNPTSVTVTVMDKDFEGPDIEQWDIPEPYEAMPTAQCKALAAYIAPETLESFTTQQSVDFGWHIEDVQRQAIVEALEKTRYNKTAAAKLLGLSFRQLRYRIKKLGIE